MNLLFGSALFSPPVLYRRPFGLVAEILRWTFGAPWCDGDCELFGVNSFGRCGSCSCFSERLLPDRDSLLSSCTKSHSVTKVQKSKCFLHSIEIWFPVTQMPTVVLCLYQLFVDEKHTCLGNKPLTRFGMTYGSFSDVVSVIVRF